MAVNIIHREHRLAGQGAIFLCAVLWSTSGLFIRLVDWHPMTIAGVRSFLAALVLLAIRLFFLEKDDNAPGKSEYIKNLAKKSPLLAVCGLCYTATMILFVAANKLTASANAIMLQYTAPVWAAILGWLFLRERLFWQHFVALIFVSAGMYLVFSGGLVAGSLTGDILALVSGITFAANSVVLRSHKDSNPSDILFFAHVICVIISIPFFFLHPPVITMRNSLCIAFMGIFQLGLASALFAYGIKRVSAVQSMLTAAIEPVLNPVWVLLAIGEKPAASVIAGGSIIIGAVLFSSILSALRRRS